MVSPALFILSWFWGESVRKYLKTDIFCVIIQNREKFVFVKLLVFDGRTQYERTHTYS